MIVEAELRSGTSITARYAREQGRQVFCIPNSINNSKGVGANIQIRRGAKLVLEPKEIIQEYSRELIEQVTIEELDKINKNELKSLSKVKEEYKEIYKLLLEENSLSEIRIKTKIDIQDLYQKLFMMEMEGLIISNKNKYKIL